MGCCERFPLRQGKALHPSVKPNLCQVNLKVQDARRLITLNMCVFVLFLKCPIFIWYFWGASQRGVYLWCQYLDSSGVPCKVFLFPKICKLQKDELTQTRKRKT